MARLARYDALALTAGLWFLAKFLRYLFPPLFVAFEAAFGLSPATLGLAYGGLMAAYAAMQFPSGALADRVGGVRVIAAGGLVAAAGAGAVAAAPGPALLILGMALVGLGTGAHKTVAIALLGGIYPRHTGRVLGAMDTLGSLGGVGAAGAVVAAAAVGPGGWRAAFAGAAALGVLLVVAFARRVPRRVPDDLSEPDTPPVRRHLARLRDPRFGAFVAATVLFSLSYNGAVAFLPYYLGVAGLGDGVAGGLYGVFFAVSVVQPATGALADRAGTLPVAVGTLALAAVGLAALLALDGALALGAAVVAFGVGAHGFRPVRGAYLVRVAPAGGAGGSLGVVRTAIMGAGAVAPAAVGAATTAGGVALAFGGLLAALVVATAVVAALALAGEP